MKFGGFSSTWCCMQGKFFTILYINRDFDSLIYFYRWFHLGFNLVVQLLFGVPLEMVHGSTRIGCVYLAGVLAGSLGKLLYTIIRYLTKKRTEESLNFTFRLLSAWCVLIVAEIINYNDV